MDHTTELWMTKYRIGEIFSSGGAALYKNPSDQTVCIELFMHAETFWLRNYIRRFRKSFNRLDGSYSEFRSSESHSILDDSKMRWEHT